MSKMTDYLTKMTYPARNQLELRKCLGYSLLDQNDKRVTLSSIYSTNYNSHCSIWRMDDLIIPMLIQ